MIIVGLGNPGTKYEKTRHNVGWMVLDEYAHREGLSFSLEKHFQAALASRGDSVFAKPQTFMNDSGAAVKKLVQQYGADFIVVHDDIDIPLGQVKCSFARGSGDHNGVQSIIDHLGTKDFFRIRIGVRPVHEELLPRIAPPNGYETFLLSNFIPMETELLKEGITKAVLIIEALFEGKTAQEIMNEHN